MASIPFENMTPLTFTGLIYSNITKKQIEAMYLEMYQKIGIISYRETSRQLDKIKMFNDNLFNEIMALWLNQNSGVRIVSVRSTLIDEVLKIITQGYANNLSAVEIARYLERTMGYYKNQMIRIVRTETTTITNSATVMAGNSSNLELEKMWVSVQDNRTRRHLYDHLDMNGQKVDQYANFFVGGEELEYPGDIKGAGGNIINCRCKVVMVAKRDADGLPIFKKN
jgi:uncharacterized protein with gpF-like domain